jgi:uncharacterized protein (UPF0332 family)
MRPGDVPELIRKSRRFLDLAEHLIGIGEFDSAVSRIYYAMFYCAEALLLARGRVYSRHQGVISAFGRYFVRTGIFPAEMGQWLASAFRERSLADYAPGAAQGAPVEVLRTSTGTQGRTRAEEWLRRGREFLRRAEDRLREEGLEVRDGDSGTASASSKR